MVAQEILSKPGEGAMQVYRQMFIAGISASFIARRVHECLKPRTEADRDYLLNYVRQKTGLILKKNEWLDEGFVTNATDRTLQAAFEAWRKAARNDGQPLMVEDALCVGGQVFVLQYLPIAPMDYGNPPFIDALSHCAHYYLS